MFLCEYESFELYVCVLYFVVCRRRFVSVVVVNISVKLVVVGR